VQPFKGNGTNPTLFQPCPSDCTCWGIFYFTIMELRLNLELEKGLTADQFYLLCHLGNYMNHKREASVSNADLSKITGFGASKLLRIKNELKEKDLLKINYSYDEKYGGQKSNSYLINSKIIEKL
jgi:hypothetical protein